MYYRLRHKDGITTTTTKEFSGNRAKAIAIARSILEDNDKKGSVVIERRMSEYYGDFSNFLTFSYNQETVDGLAEL